jgi:hypothetical protein
MIRITISKRVAFLGMLLLVMAIAGTVFAQTIGASSSIDAGRQIRNQSFQPETLREMVQRHQLASTVQVLASQPPSVVIQFPLFPSGVKKAFPQATGVVTIVQGNPAVSLFDSVTVDVAHMPPDITFTIFFIELANKPFGHVEYIADLHTRDDVLASPRSRRLHWSLSPPITARRPLPPRIKAARHQASNWNISACGSPRCKTRRRRWAIQP